MIKKNKVKIIISSIITLLPAVIGLFLWQRLPERLAVHWGTDNQPNGWSSKAMAVFGIPLLLLAVHLLVIFLTASDRRHKNVDVKLLSILFFICPMCSVLCSAGIYATALGFNFDIGLSACLFIGFLFILLGNYMPKCKQNYFVGIKLPWTLDNADNWYHTHRVAGISMITGGIIAVISAFFHAPWLLLTALIASVLIPIVYSYIYYLKHSNKHN